MVVSELTASAAAMKSATPAEGGSKSIAASDLPPLQNRAKDGSTPFLRGHGESLIAWQLLDKESVERAAKENKLVYLHIGFKACHFCRLMCQESFSNSDCASIINESFIPVLVDREARPDIDAIYMNYVQAVSNSGGWPLNLFLTPQLEPVFGGTYWPGPASARRTSEDAGDEPLDFLVILRKVNDIWKDQQARCRKEAAEVVGQLREFAAEGTLGTKSIAQSQQIGSAGWPSPAPAPGPTSALPSSSSTTAQPRPADSDSLGDLDLDQLEEAYTHIAGTFDPVYGGFGLAPKFLTPPKLDFLLSLRRSPSAVQDVVGEAECKHAVDMAVKTLQQIRDGALHDHVGQTGFSRCSVTPDWSIPNFEKLVVDNASLLSLYLEAWRIGGAREGGEFLDVVVELADYLSSAPIALPDGGFATSEAADSYNKRGDREMREGAYYLWTRREFDSVVDAAAAAAAGNKHISPVVAAHWGVLEDGNVDEDHDPNDDFINLNILRVQKSPDELAKQFSLPADTVREYIATAKRELKKRRERERQRPEIDDKIVAGHSGLVVSALARTAAGLAALEPTKSEHYLATAEKAARFIQQNLWDDEAGILYRIWSSGRRDVEGFADDYAYLISGLLDLYTSTRNESYLEFADNLQKSQAKLFYDPVGAFYSTAPSHPHSILRLKDGMDTSLPSTNAVSVANLFRLGAVLADDKFAAMARDTVSAFEAEMLQHPWLFPGLLGGVVTARLGVEGGGGEHGLIKYRDLRTKA
ncbi:Spermatogenesis-associated protein 20 [Escovopsis weberi]|uniref:Spermatogenesis-associated protein 20 n=1 Tax=Escovopsis weberi TaxID=150374 RepID=A0A0M9VVK7_ESCWE|nr:Spermatogenesis-associated protein 20 [Escovopsis weberi]